MIHEQVSTILSNLIHLVFVFIAIGWLIAIALGKIDITSKLKDLDTFEIARFDPIFQEIEQPPANKKSIILEEVVKPKKPKKMPEHPLYKDCVLALRAIGTPASDAKVAARDYLTSYPNVNNVQDFLVGIFRQKQG